MKFIVLCGRRGIGRSRLARALWIEISLDTVDDAVLFTVEARESLVD